VSDLIKRMKATLRMGVISSGSTSHEYAIAESQFKEAADALEAKDKHIAELEAEIDILRHRMISIKAIAEAALGDSDE